MSIPHRKREIEAKRRERKVKSGVITNLSLYARTTLERKEGRKVCNDFTDRPLAAATLKKLRKKRVTPCQKFGGEAGQFVV